MTIIDFYKKLSQLLTDAREDFISHNQTKKRLEKLLDEAKENKLNVKIDPSIIDPVNLMRLDDENSFSPNDDQDFSYDSSFESSY